MIFLIKYLPLILFLTINLTMFISYLIAKFSGHIKYFSSYYHTLADKPIESCFFGFMMNIIAYPLFLLGYIHYVAMHDLSRSFYQRWTLDLVNFFNFMAMITIAVGFLILANFSRSDCKIANFIGMCFVIYGGLIFMTCSVIISASLSWEVVLGRTITVIRIILLVLYLLFLVGNFALLYMSPAFTAVGTEPSPSKTFTVKGDVDKLKLVCGKFRKINVLYVYYGGKMDKTSNDSEELKCVYPIKNITRKIQAICEGRRFCNLEKDQQMVDLNYDDTSIKYDHILEEDVGEKKRKPAEKRRILRDVDSKRSCLMSNLRRESNFVWKTPRYSWNGWGGYEKEGNGTDETVTPIHMETTSETHPSGSDCPTDSSIYIAFRCCPDYKDSNQRTYHEAAGVMEFILIFLLSIFLLTYFYDFSDFEGCVYFEER